MPELVQETTEQTENEEMLDSLMGDAVLETLREHSPESLTPGGYAMQRSAASVLQAVDEAAMTATFVIVTRSNQPNRQGNKVQITESRFGRGLLTDHFDKNPVVLFEHGQSGIALPVGLSSEIKKQKTKATATVSFSELSHAEPIFAAVAEGVLRMASIGFDPTKAMLVKQNQEKLSEGVESLSFFRGLDFVESEMMEWSITAVGADRGALRQALDRGKIHDCKMPDYMRQSFEKAAGGKTVWSPGADFSRRTIETLGITLEGEPEAVDQAFQKLSESEEESTQHTESITTQIQTEKQNAVDPEAPTGTTPKRNDGRLAAMFLGREAKKQRIDQRSLAADVGRRIREKVQKLSAECLELKNEFERRTGKVTEN